MNEAADPSGVGQPVADGRVRPPLGWLTAVWLIVAAVFYGPLNRFLAHPQAIRQPLTHAAMFLVAAGAVLLLIGLLTRSGVERSVATYASVTAIVFFWSGRSFTDRFGLTLGLVTFAAVLAAVTLVIIRLRSLPALHMVFFGWGVFMTLSPWLVQLDTSVPLDRRPVQGSSVEFAAEVQPAPDLVLVILDGYPGIQTMAEYPGWNGRVVDELTARGFSVFEGWTAYSTTSLSLAGLFDGSYPVTPVDGYASATRPADTIITQGEGAAFDFFDDAGYAITMIEPPWDGYRCPDVVDECVAAPILDELLYFTLEHSLIGELLERRSGSAWIHAAEQTWPWLRETARVTAANDRPDFVIAHVISPHEPLLQNASCEVQYDRARDVTGLPRLDDQSGLRAFLDQAACVDRRILELVDALDDDAWVIFTGDHGSALSGQSFRPIAQWSESDLRERMSAFVGVRVPDRCQPEPPVMVQELLRGVMRCLGAAPLKDLPTTMLPTALFVTDEGLPMRALSDAEVESLIASR